MVKAIGDDISMGEYNSLVYLLRKFKKLVRHETMSKVLEMDVGTLNITSGFTNVGENFILENDVNIISKNCLPLTTYYFTFYIVNADTSETLLETPITLSTSTDKYGNLNLIIPENLLSDGEEIRRDIKIEITFQEHEGVSPARLLNLDLTTNKKYISNGETATITATLLDTNNDPLEGYTVYFDVNGIEISRVTNSSGKAVITFTGTGDTGVLNIKVQDKEINIIDYYFYDHAISTDHNDNYWFGYWNINYRPQSTIIGLCKKEANYFCPSTIPTQLDITKRLEFDTPYSMEFDIYYPDENVHLRVWDGNTSPYTVYFDYPLNKLGHYKLIVDEDVIQLWIDNILVEKQIEVTGDTSVSFVSVKTNTAICKFLEFANLIIYNYETYEPPMHDYSLSLTGTSTIQSGDSDTITATLLDNNVGVEGQRLSYQIKKGSTVIDSGSSTTDTNGQIEIDYTGTGVGDIYIIVSFGAVIQETFIVEDCKFYDDQSSNKLSQYTTKIGSVTPTYQSGYIQISGSNNWNGVSPIGINSANDWSMECEIKSNSNILNGLLLLKDTTNFISDVFYPPQQVYGYASYNYSNSSNTPLFVDNSIHYTINTWNKFKLELKSNTLYYYLYNSDGILLASKTAALPSNYQNSSLYFCPVVYNGTAQFRNVKIKAL